MRFFKKKDKRKKDDGFGEGGGGGGGSMMPGFGSDNRRTFGSDFRPADNGGYGYGSRSPPGGAGAGAQQHHNYYHQSRPSRRSASLLARFDAQTLNNIFGWVCPHSLDETYETCENSSTEDGACMLCDLRDLAECVLVCKPWRKEAVKRLYHSIRIDTVHYCAREIQLSEERKKRGSFFDRNGEPEDTAQARLKLLCRTLREDPVRLGKLVRFLKTPYMLRESSQADLARTIAVTPNLRYVDLPEGLFTDDPAYVTLRLEVQARCHDLRKMTYIRGSERSLQALAHGQIWTRLEVLELIRINMDPAMLRQVLGALGYLRALKISESECVTDQVLGWNDMLPPFPPLEEFILTNCPHVTADGLLGWLVPLPEAQQALRVLTLNGTGVRVGQLQEVCGAYTPNLKHLSVIEGVSVAMQQQQGGILFSCPSLETLHYEITVSAQAPKFSSAGVTSSYYNYLASSLLSGGLPNLRALYVREPNFPELLLGGLPPPAPAFAGGMPLLRPSSSSGSMTSSAGGGGGFLSPSAQSGSSGGGGGFLSPSSLGGQGSPRMSSSQQYLNPFAGGGGHHNRGQGSVSSLNSGSLWGSPQHTGDSGERWKPGHRAQQFSSNNPFAGAAAAGMMSTSPTGGIGGGGIGNLPARMEVFTKGDDDQLSWSFVQLPPSSTRNGDGKKERPLSSYGLGADVMGGNAAGWSSGAGARKSVLVGRNNGAGGGLGGFLAVPSENSGGVRGRAAGRNAAAGATIGNFSSSFGSSHHARGGSDAAGAGEDLWPRPRPTSSSGESRRDLWR
ncbi:hypothetical protein B0H66DRAFT_588150 [Apodospora peruviana]|uniref:F-box domain-containing protein n=1 Tax=Apodospora peruviana TaxID=516989 RepID=A0AAE0IJ84_9PEZI|nr:hypothetical protein B0H66DRAFT_588150 [Apodospora peruviana]